LVVAASLPRVPPTSFCDVRDLPAIGLECTGTPGTGLRRAMITYTPNGGTYAPPANWPWPPPGHTTSGAVRTVISALVASHLAQLDHQVGVGLALPFLVRRQYARRGRQAVPLLRDALRTSGGWRLHRSVMYATSWQWARMHRYARNGTAECHDHIHAKPRHACDFPKGRLLASHRLSERYWKQADPTHHSAR
jgi:hypothetical protein